MGWFREITQPSVVCRSKFLFAVLPQVRLPLVCLSPFSLNPSYFFAPSGTPYIYIYIYRYFSLHVLHISPAPINLLLSSLLSHSLCLQSALLSKIRFVSLPASAPDTTLTELSQFHIRYEKVIWKLLKWAVASSLQILSVRYSKNIKIFWDLMPCQLTLLGKSCSKLLQNVCN